MSQIITFCLCGEEIMRKNLLVFKRCLILVSILIIFVSLLGLSCNADTMVEEYSPILYFEGEETCYPISAEFHIQNSYLYQVEISSPISTSPTETEISGYSSDLYQEYYLDNQPEANCLISVCDAQHVRLPTLYYKKDKTLEQALKQANPHAIRQKMRPLYWRNGAVYITRRDILMKNRKLISHNPFFYEMPRSRSIAIDDMFDWSLAEILLNQNNKNKED